MPCPPPGDLPHPGIEPMSLMFPALAGRFFNTKAATWQALNHCLHKLLVQISEVIPEEGSFCQGNKESWS